MRHSGAMKQAARIVFSVFAACIVLFSVYFIPLPFYVFKPGTADVLKPMVEATAAGDDRGQFMLTTVQLSDVNVVGYLLSFVTPYQELQLKKEVLKNNETREEYSERQELVMLTSQAGAVQAAYNKLGVPYRIQKEGVAIQQVYADFPASEVLRAGDYITEVNGQAVATFDELRALLEPLKAGDTVQLAYKRKGVIRTKELAVAVLPNQEKVPDDQKRVGLGVVPVEVQSVRAESDDKQVNITAGSIGGPSAGLMFALEIYNRLHPDDITKGYKIAGTGEIDQNGKVGVIGGIKFKVVAADREGADIFFAPKDSKLADGRVIPNYSDAVKRAEELGTKMKIVPVGTLDEALDYLASLPPKP
ncbi:SepM family pheromone-processing serine protease [Paenibacillus sp. YYML68]|uniref:SepM family pheromone-processing serine protease n=1 Tax=Paenibacillus sp. YYML68 TaxID=2909250 RepID=UPI002493618B|nr:SepM family pheromone-processing serine protease [Paenibacillus sp. YYML68]